MYNKEFFIEEFKRLGFLPTDTVFVHSSYRKIAGEEGVEGGADTVLDAFMEYFGKEGLVVFPAMSWRLGYLVNDAGEVRDPSLGSAEGFRPYGNHYNVRTTPAEGLGILPELFRHREGVIRSLSPKSSVAAYGPDAEAFCAGHQLSKTPLSWDAPWGRLYDRKAKFFFLGTSLGCNTFMHVLEERAETPGSLTPYVWEFTVEDYDGKVWEYSCQGAEYGHSNYYSKITAEFLEKGIAKKCKFASADSYIIEAVPETEYMMKRFEEEPTLFVPAYNKK